MASTYTSRLRLELQANGENDSSWGTLLNTVITLADSAIAGMATIATTGGSTTLSANNAAADQARMAIIKVTGVLVSNATLVIPAVTKTYVVWNATTGAYTLTLKTSGGTGVVVAQGKKAFIFCDATDCFTAFDDTILSTPVINEAKGSAVASAATTSDIWAVTGSTVHITGTTGMSGLPAAPQAGVWRNLIFDDAVILTDGANFVVPGGNYTTSADDLVFVYADTTTKFYLFPLRASGAALTGATAGVTAGNVAQVDQAVTAWTRAATTTLGTTLNGTLSDTSTTITGFAGMVAGVTYHVRCLGAGEITHHATNLIITQSLASIAATATGDTFDVEALTATTCRLKNFVRAAALPATLGANTFTGGQTMSGASVIDANASIAAHATTMNPWSLGNYVTATGAAVTFTGMAAAPQAGAEVEIYMNAAHIFTDGAVFEVDGDQNYTATIGDRVLLRAKSTTVFTVHPRKKDGTAVVAAGIADDSVTYAKIQNVTSARLLGRATALAGDTEEITLGTNLSFTGTTLNAASSSPTGSEGITVVGSDVRMNTNNSGGVGAYALLMNNSGGGITNGSTIAGSSLRFAKGAVTSNLWASTGDVPAGTWRNVSGTTLSDQEFGIFIRTA